MTRARTRTVAVSHNQEHNHEQRPRPLTMAMTRTHCLFVPRAWMVRSMDCAWIAPGSVGTSAGRWGGIILYCTVCACTIAACLVCCRSGLAHASGVGGGSGEVTCGWPGWPGLPWMSWIGQPRPKIFTPFECASGLVCLRALRTVKRAGGISEI